jgi:hypothetical protein
MQNLFWVDVYMVSVVVLCIFAAATVPIYYVPLVEILVVFTRLRDT